MCEGSVAEMSLTGGGPGMHYSSTSPIIPVWSQSNPGVLPVWSSSRSIHQLSRAKGQPCTQTHTCIKAIQRLIDSDISALSASVIIVGCIQYVLPRRDEETKLLKINDQTQTHSGTNAHTFSSRKWVALLPPFAAQRFLAASENH